MKNKGFSLIELLAVIIILGILMLIAIPSVTSYINNSRRETYINTINELVKGSQVMVNGGELEVNDPNTTYYVPASAVKTENGVATSPYGKISDAYIVVTYDGDNYDYYYVGRDSADMGIPAITKVDLLKKELIEGNLDITSTTVGIGERENIIVFKGDGSGIERTDTASSNTSGTPLTKVVCKRATELDTEQCNSDNCRPYNSGAPVTYGSLGTKGTLATGDAFDCDVNGDGNFNERFYYLSDFYDTSTLTFDDQTAVLMYAHPYYQGSIGYENVDYAAAPEIGNYADNSKGPVTAIKHLPTSSSWSNVTLKKVKRAILAENQDTHNALYTANASCCTLPTDFSYAGKAARLPAAQEIMRGCNITRTVSWTYGELDSCIFVFQDTQFTDSSNQVSYIWLETPRYSVGDTVLDLNPYTRQIVKNSSNLGYSHEIKPVIDVPKNRIDY